MFRRLVALLGASLLACGVAAADTSRAFESWFRADGGPRSRGHALVIGIDRFDNEAAGPGRSWSRLRGVAPEVSEVRAALEQHGFVVRTPPDNPEWEDRQSGRDDGPQLPRITRERLQSEIQSFLNAHRDDPDARLVIYIASHGFAEADGIGYIATADTPVPGAPGAGDAAYSVRDLARHIAQVRSRHVLLVFNACFSGAMIPRLADYAGDGNRGLSVDESLDASRSAVVTDQSLIDLVQRLWSKPARAILTAGSDGEEVPDVNNPFARAFTEGLAGRADLDGDGVILAGELVHFIRTQVAQAPLARDRTSPVFAALPDPRSDARQQRLTIESEFVFASPVGRIGAAAQRRPDAILVARQSQLSATQHVDCADCPVMVRLPPLHPEPARPIALSRTETTYAEWDACYRDLFCTRYLEDGGAGRGDRPASGITWQDQDEFIAWLNFQKARRRPVDGSQRCSRYRLPTPEEWRHAALAGSRSSLPWGARPEPGRAHCRGCGSGFEEGRAAPVGRTTPNRFGLHDMLGNVWEWVAAGGSPCEPERLAKGMCSAGAVMGGGFTTAVDQLAMTMGSLAPSRDGARLDLAGLATPRTVNRLSRTDGLRPHIHPAIGLRPLCELGAP